MKVLSGVSITAKAEEPFHLEAFREEEHAKGETEEKTSVGPWDDSDRVLRAATVNGSWCWCRKPGKYSWADAQAEAVCF